LEIKFLKKGLFLTRTEPFSHFLPFGLSDPYYRSSLFRLFLLQIIAGTRCLYNNTSSLPQAGKIG
jgi:hypothetical protein